MKSLLPKIVCRCSSLLVFIFITGLSSNNSPPLLFGYSLPTISKRSTSSAYIPKMTRSSNHGLFSPGTRWARALNDKPSTQVSQSSKTSSSPTVDGALELGKIPVYLLVLLPRSSKFLFSIERVSPAITLATDNVTTSQLLTRHRLVTLYADSKCHIAEAMNEAIKFYIQGKVDVFIGPVCDYSMAPVARQAKYWNLPVITSGAMARDFSAQKYILYNTLTRVGSRYNTLIEFLAVVFKQFRYKRVNLVYDPHGQGDILDKLCHVMTDGIHSAFNNEYNISNVATKWQLMGDIEPILREQIGVKFADSNPYLKVWKPGHARLLTAHSSVNVRVEENTNQCRAAATDKSTWRVL